MRSDWDFLVSLVQVSKSRVAVGVLLAVMRSACIFPIAYLVKTVMDVAIPGGQLGYVVALGGGILAFSLLQGVLSYLVTSTNVAISTELGLDVRSRLFRKLHRLPRCHLTGLDRGELLNLLISESEAMLGMVRSILSLAIPGILPAIVMVLVMAYLSLELLGVLLLLTPLFLLTRWGILQRIREAARRSREAHTGYVRDVNFTLGALDLIRLRLSRKRTEVLHEPTLSALADSVTSIRRLAAFYEHFQDLVAAGVGVLVLIAGGFSVILGRMTLGDLMSFYVVLGMLRSSYKTFMRVATVIPRGQEALRVIRAFLEIDREAPYLGSKEISFSGAVTFESVSFGYPDRTPLFEGVDVRLEAGEVVAVVGPNGSGKSTLMHLLVGFHGPTEGRLLADDVPYDELDMDSYRRQVALAMQSPSLFSGTIRENIAFGLEDLPFEEVLRVSEMANAHEFVRELPGEYEARIGDDGVLLSGGQRQKISLARSLLGNPRLLVFDEPANHLDSASLKRLMASLRSIDPSPTIVLVSHDPEVVAVADRILAIVDRNLVPIEELPSYHSIEVVDVKRLQGIRGALAGM